MIIGIIGGVGAGKSVVTRGIATQAHATVINADEVAHGVLRLRQIREQVETLLGPSVLDGTGELDRPSIAKAVFGDSEAQIANRKALEAIVHPEVRRQIKEQIAQLQANDPACWILLDIPLLLESGWDAACDRVLYVDTPDELRMSIALKRGWAREDWERREASQLSLSEKRGSATDILVNDGSLEQLEIKIRELVDRWKQDASIRGKSAN